MLGWFQWNEIAPSSATSAASANAVTNTDPSSTAGTLSSSDLDQYDYLQFICEMIGNTGGTLDVFVQTFIAGVWYDFLHIKQLASGASAVKYSYVSGRFAGVSGVVIGAGSTPLLASDVITGGLWGEQFRLWMVSGTSTSVGAAVKVTMIGQLPRQNHGR